MPQKKPRVTELELQKQLLIAESEINRAELRQDWQALTGTARGLARQAKSYNTIAVSVVALVAGLASYARTKPAAPKSTSWFQKLTGVVRFATTLWMAFRTQPPEAEKTKTDV